ncbi:MAG TPA: phosphoglucosamine mutase [Acidimicrobiales bacterium]|jgi:phosphoglucosamine mutase|nr:phosphoglucosamine mutase [Acidimicrobiales bacterium]
MTLKFGTDGVRGVANAELTPELVLALGRAAARVIGGRRWLVGRDTRLSGPMLQAALSAGLASEGIEVVDLGVIPTPGVAWASASQSAPAAMISASHNPFGDNGIKFFTAGGRKLSDEMETRLERELASLADTDALPLAASPPAETVASTEGRVVIVDPAVAAPPIHVGARTAGQIAGPRVGAQVGDLVGAPEVVDRYVDHLERVVLEGRRLDGIRVVIDCANGAASVTAPRVLQTLGCEVTVLHAQPNGQNINDACGSTYPADLQRAVPQRRAHLGLAFDGDADRVIAVDAEGHLIDGDQLIALLAIDHKQRGQLADDTVVVTIMSNLGFRLGMERRGIRVVETQVGDRNVLEALEHGRWSLGGEQSGHIIFRDLATTGDGLLTGLQVLDALARTGKSLGDLANLAMTRLPQVLVNVKVAQRRPDLLDDLAPFVAKAEEELSGEGRVVVRASGTEPVVRVMVEASTRETAVGVADRLAEAVGQVSRGATAD